jgi:hypothetical protein
MTYALSRSAALGSRDVTLPKAPPRGNHQVLDSHVGRSACRYTVIASAGAVAVKFLNGYAANEEELACRTGLLDGAGRAHVIGSDRVAEDAERLEALNVAALFE